MKRREIAQILKTPKGEVIKTQFDLIISTAVLWWGGGFDWLITHIGFE